MHTQLQDRPAPCCADPAIARALATDLSVPQSPVQPARYGEDFFQKMIDRDVGSISPGKMADFAVLDADPYTVDPEEIENIGVWSTVFEGKPFIAAT